MYIYSILDKVAERFSAPFVAVNAGVAHRQFENSFKEVPEIHAQDFELYQIGEFDEKCGSVKDSDNVICGSGLDFVDKSEKTE